MNQKQVQWSIARDTWPHAGSEVRHVRSASGGVADWLLRVNVHGRQGAALWASEQALKIADQQLRRTIRQHGVQRTRSDCMCKAHWGRTATSILSSLSCMARIMLKSAYVCGSRRCHAGLVCNELPAGVSGRVACSHSQATQSHGPCRSNWKTNILSTV